jgi:hypothetical protein
VLSFELKKFPEKIGFPKVPFDDPQGTSWLSDLSWAICLERSRSQQVVYWLEISLGAVIAVKLKP